MFWPRTEAWSLPWCLELFYSFHQLLRTNSSRLVAATIRWSVSFLPIGTRQFLLQLKQQPSTPQLYRNDESVAVVAQLQFIKMDSPIYIQYSQDPSNNFWSSFQLRHWTNEQNGSQIAWTVHWRIITGLVDITSSRFDILLFNSPRVRQLFLANFNVWTWASFIAWLDVLASSTQIAGRPEEADNGERARFPPSKWAF